MKAFKVHLFEQLQGEVAFGSSTPIIHANGRDFQRGLSRNTVSVFKAYPEDAKTFCRPNAFVNNLNRANSGDFIILAILSWKYMMGEYLPTLYF